MTVSVITITRHDHVGLARTIASVANQVTTTDVEHIVIDGASGGVVEELLRGSPSVNAWLSEPDSGRYDAMNKGIRLAEGSFLWFMHSGDTFGGVDSIELAMQAVASNGASWGYGYARLIDAENGFAGSFGFAPFNVAQFKLGGRPLPHQACFFSRELVDQIGGYSLMHGLAADQLFLLQAALVERPVVVPQFLCDFDTGGAGSTRGWAAHLLDMRKARIATQTQVGDRMIFDVPVTAALLTRRLVQLALGRAVQGSRKRVSAPRQKRRRP